MTDIEREALYNEIDFLQREVEQVCENDIKNRKINTFKCLVDGSISLSWNKNNVIIP